MEDKIQYPEETLSFVERIPVTKDVYTYVFRPENPVSYLAGQYGHVRVSGMPEGVRAVREFSFLSAPHERDIRFGIDIRSGSGYQRRLDALSPGDTVSLFKIKKHMTWPPPVSIEAVMIGGGIGVTPFHSMLLDKKQKGLTVRTTLLHVSRDGFAYEGELQALADTYEKLSKDRFVERILQVATELPTAHYYVAGSTRFVDAVQTLLAAKGITPESDPFKGLED